VIGKLINWNRERGFGFLSHSEGSRERTFVHIKQIQKGGVDVPRDGDVYEFDIEQIKEGRHAAANLRLVN
jgi:cold shock CspA family protein